MKVFAFDQKNNDKWHKNWNDLGKMDVIKCNSSSDRKEAISNIFNIAIHESVLVLIHQECCQNFFKEFITEIQHNEKIFVMFVTGGNQPLFDDNSLPNIHYSKRALPTGTELTSFKNLFSNLCFELEQAGEHDKIKSAWDNWEYSSLTTPDNKNNSKLIHDLKSFLNFTKSLSVSDENIAKLNFNKLPEDFINQLNNIRKTLEPLYLAEYVYENQITTENNNISIRLLVIDDKCNDKDIQGWIRSKFEGCSIEFFSAMDKNGEYTVKAALEKINKYHPDGIVLDVWFGEGDAAEKLGDDIYDALNEEYQDKTLRLSSDRGAGRLDAEKGDNSAENISQITQFIDDIRSKKTPSEKLTKENILPSFKNHRQRFWHDELSFLCQAVELTKNTKGINRVEAARILKDLKDPEEGSSNDFDRWFRQVWRDLDSEQKAKARQETDMPLLTKIFEELNLEGLKKPKKEKKERAKVGTQYYDPNSQQTWIGTRGGKAMPLWLRNLIASGRKLSDLEVRE